MLLPFDPLLTVRFGGRRFNARLGTLCVVAIACAGAAAAGGEAGAGWLAGSATVVVVAVALVGHFSARAWAGGRLGLPIRRAHLAVFGGVSDALDDAGTPRAEALIGLAGLAAIGAPAAVGVALSLLTRESPAIVRDPIRAASVALTGLAVVQAMPALPLDGGRLLRGIVWYLTDNPVTGARVAALYAHVVSAGLIAFGVIALGFDGALPYWGLWALVGGWQLGGEARAGVHRLGWQRLSRATTLGDLAFPLFALPASATIEDALDTLIGAGSDAPFLVNADGRPAGVVRLSSLRGWPRAEWDRRTIGEAMTSVAGLPRLPAGRPAHDALALLDDLEGDRTGVPGAPVVLVERDGVPVAALDRRQVLVRLLSLERRDGEDGETARRRDRQ